MQFKQLQKCHSLRQPLYFRMHNAQSNRVIIKHVLKGQGLMKLTILTDSFKTFLSKTRFFFHKGVAVKNTMITNIVWHHCLNLSKALQIYSSLLFHHQCKVRTVKKTNNILVQLWKQLWLCTPLKDSQGMPPNPRRPRSNFEDPLLR